LENSGAKFTMMVINSVGSVGIQNPFLVESLVAYIACRYFFKELNG
jgi:hypothetical protein